MNGQPIRLVVLFSTVALVVAACGASDVSSDSTAAEGSEAADVVAVSSDGSARLVVPAAALPDDVAPADVRVEVLDPATLGAEPIEATPQRAYELLPNGAKLGEPATLTIDLTQEEADGGLTFAHVSEDSAELISPTVIDRTEGTVTVVFELSHFSSLYQYELLHSGRVRWEEPAKGSTFQVGETFRVRIQVRYEPTVYRYRYGGHDWQFAPGDQWSLTGELSSSRTGPLQPKEMPDAPPLTRPSGPSFTTEGEFTCVEAGSGIVFYQVEVGINEATVSSGVYSRTFDSDMTGDPLTVSFFESRTVDCVGQEEADNDTSVGESVSGASTSELTFEPWPGGPPGVVFTAPFEINVTEENSLFVVKQTQMPSNQVTTGLMRPSDGVYLAFGGEGYIEVYLGRFCPTSDGSGYWLYGLTFGGNEELAGAELVGLPGEEDFRSELQKAIDSGPDPFFDRIGVDFDFGIDDGCDLDLDTARERAAGLLADQAASPLPGDWGGIFFGYAGE